MTKTKKTEAKEVKSLYARYYDMNLSDQRRFKQFCRDTVGISMETMHRWIRGVHSVTRRPYVPGALERIAIAGFFGVSPLEIWDETPIKSPKKNVA